MSDTHDTPPDRIAFLICVKGQANVAVSPTHLAACCGRCEGSPGEADRIRSWAEIAGPGNRYVYSKGVIVAVTGPVTYDPGSE